MDIPIAKTTKCIEFLILFCLATGTIMSSEKGFSLKKIMWEVLQGSDYFSGLCNFLVKSMCFSVTYHVDVLFTYDTYFVFRLISKNEAADWINNKSDLGRYW